SIEESAEVGRRANVPVQIAHHKVVGRFNFGNSKYSQARIMELRSEGIDIVCDQYPYVAASTTITTIFAHWAHEGGVDGLLARLINPETRARLKSEVLSSMDRTGRRFDDILIAGVSGEANKRFEGLTVTEAAAQAGKEPCEFIMDIVVEEKAGVAVVTFGMDEADVKHIMAHPLTMIGSDGLAVPLVGPGKPHPRTFGTFVRVLAKYALIEKIFTFEEAVRKMTSLPASRARLLERGIIRPGFAADLVLLDLNTLADRATYAEPRQAPAGICKVWVNGQLAVDNDKTTPTRAGQVLRLNS
ncbi:MAG: amidohydrolase family protein, partial [Bacillota bacterium]|nr:amidohydrolase family protein [Bacillota bacterium]